MQIGAMSLRLATFNIENLMSRFDFGGFRNELLQDRALSLYKIDNQKEYEELERARSIGLSDDTRQLSALAIAATRADLVCLQEVDNIEALRAFEYGYLYKMIGRGYRNKHVSTGNDSRGIDVAVMAREETRHGQPIEMKSVASHASVTYEQFGLHTAELAAMGLGAHERIFKRDCLEVELDVGGRPFTLFLAHLKSMNGGKNGQNGRDYTMPVRVAEAAAIRRIIENKFGRDKAAERNWAICGDLNDYRERIVITGDEFDGFRFDHVREERSGIDPLFADGFCVNVVERLPEKERWTLYHTRGPEERHLCQLDYILLSPALAARTEGRKPDIIRQGQPFRTVIPPGQEPNRFPRIGWDRPKASDHCPVAMTIDVI